MNKWWFIISRTIFESEVWTKSPELLKIRIYLCWKANHKWKKYWEYIIKRWQCFVTHSDLKQQLTYKIGYRTKTYNTHYTKTLMKQLMKALMITTTKTPRWILVTVVNYDKYQSLDNYENSNENSNENFTKVTPINKNDKNEKEKKKKKNPALKKNSSWNAEEKKQNRLGDADKNQETIGIMSDYAKNNPDKASAYVMWVFLRLWWIPAKTETPEKFIKWFDTVLIATERTHKDKNLKPLLDEFEKYWKAQVLTWVVEQKDRKSTLRNRLAKNR